MSIVMEIIISVLLVTGGLFALAGAIGLARLPDFYTRLHGPTKATTLGVGGIVFSSVVFFSVSERTLGIEEILIMVFLFLTAPISANMMAKAAMHLRIDRVEGTRGNPWDQ
ncbi:Na+/H+ antiporter subunit G [Marinobacter nanhaiticus D15-8W]|uniref:Na+/H+ antiporter subunit G n=1 Tax=Marinobacter nanhaiticus D15-8W TaxID=626887 RepID=N6VZ29_9GAMM|nr:Na+/H+ antiporter subunit G [Marinobacter nanhaiticus]ENO13129.1 Na+/H+ antiporter subunit G [Marinobacter nanhaiticus D15-8W]BES70486.1 Na+/H+ antiporter subunit G [Marinobacter nanhaiticus D15-8W]